MNFGTVPTIAFFVFHFIRDCVMLFGIFNQGSLKKNKGWREDGVRPRVCDICSCYNKLSYIDKTPLIELCPFTLNMFTVHLV